MVLSVGCQRELSDQPPPLRPLVYTEAQPGDDSELVPGEELEMYTTPEDLGIAFYRSLVDRNRELFEQVFVNADELVDLVRLKHEVAAERAAGLMSDSERVWDLFVGRESSELPTGGLPARLELLEFRVGKGRDLSGKVIRNPDDPVVQHWGSSLRLQLRGQTKVFELRVPKLVKTKNGWKIGAATELSPTLQTYLEAGMHLKSELLTAKHYPYPLEVGNFWKYRLTLSPGSELIPEPIAPPTEEGETPTDAAPEPITPLPVGDPTLRVSITEIERKDGYLIATFEEDININGQSNVKSYRILATPRMIYPCTRDCKRKANDVGYLLGYMAQQTPTMMFPLEPNAVWDKAGRPGKHNKFEVGELRERTEVEAGDFLDAWIITGSMKEGREVRYFVPGTGVVRRQVRESAGPRTEELIDYRLML